MPAISWCPPAAPPWRRRRISPSSRRSATNSKPRRVRNWLRRRRARSSSKNFKLELKAKAGAEGKLFGSIGTADIAEAAVKAGQPISRSEVRMPTGPIRVTGDHQVQLHLHTDVDVTLMVTIVAEE